jgi:hypothetical protein
VKHNKAANADIETMFLIISFSFPLCRNVIVADAISASNVLISDELHMNNCGARQGRLMGAAFHTK